MVNDKKNSNITIHLNKLHEDEVSRKLLFKRIAIWLTEKKDFDLNLVGTKTQISVLQNAMLESKKFHDELLDPHSTLESVSDKLMRKHSVAESFNKVLKTFWLL
jgi:hypothetical protein